MEGAPEGYPSLIEVLAPPPQAWEVTKYMRKVEERERGRDRKRNIQFDK